MISARAAGAPLARLVVELVMPFAAGRRRAPPCPVCGPSDRVRDHMPTRRPCVQAR